MRLDTAVVPIPWARPAIDDAEVREVLACFESGWLTCGPRVEKFEQEMAKRAGRLYGIAVSNGTAALDLALRVLGIGRGDEVLLPAFSYVATASMVVMQGARPVFADVDPRNLCLDPVQTAVEAAAVHEQSLGRSPGVDWTAAPCCRPAPRNGRRRRCVRWP